MKFDNKNIILWNIILLNVMKWTWQPAVYMLLLILRVDTWVLKQALPVLQLSKNAAEALSSLPSTPFSCFVHPLHLWKKLSLSKLPQSMWVVNSSSQKFAECSKGFRFFFSYLVYLDLHIYILVCLTELSLEIFE